MSVEPPPATVHVNPQLLEIPESLLKEAAWKTCFAAPFATPEHITVLESRGSVSAARRIARGSYGSRRRHLVLVDDLVLMLGLGRGRCRSYHLLKACRRILCVSVATGSIFRFRWVPSERNTVDHAFRLWEPLRKGIHGAVDRFRGFGC